MTRVVFHRLGAGTIALCLSLAGSMAHASIKRPPPPACYDCGVAFMRPLSGRVVSPDHVVEVRTHCWHPVGELLPVLMDGDEEVPSEWVSADEGIIGENFRRWRRTGPALPVGKRIVVGSRGAPSCQLSNPGGFEGVISCAPNEALDCCARETESFLSRFTFDVEDVQDPVSARDASADSAPVEDESRPFGLHCVANEVSNDPNDQIEFYLDVGGATLDPRIVQLSLRWSQAVNYYALDWYAPPCLGQSTRSFHAEPFGNERFELWLAAGTVPATVTYEITAGSETGPLGQPTEGTLALPGDCVAPTELGPSWQRFDFSVTCEEGFSSPEPDWATAYPELEMTRSEGDCWQGAGRGTPLVERPTVDAGPSLVDPASSAPDASTPESPAPESSAPQDDPEGESEPGLEDAAPTSPPRAMGAGPKVDAAHSAKGCTCSTPSRTRPSDARLLGALWGLVLAFAVFALRQRRPHGKR